MKKKDMSELSQIKQDLRNYKTMYLNQKHKVLILKEENKKLKESLEEIEKQISILKQEKETDKNTIEEYKRMIFHKKSQSNNNESKHKSIFNEAKNIKRTIDSYKKSIPKKEEIDYSIKYDISICSDCNTPLINKKNIKNILKI